MPDYTYIYGTTGSVGSWDSVFYQQYCDKINTEQRQWEQQMWEQQMEEEIQLREDKEKFPLFFWRELCERKQRKTCKPLKGKKK